MPQTPATWMAKKMRPDDERAYRQFDAAVFDGCLAGNAEIQSFVLGVTKSFHDEAIALEALRKTYAKMMTPKFYRHIDEVLTDPAEVNFNGTAPQLRMMVDLDEGLKIAGGFLHVHGMFIYPKTSARGTHVIYSNVAQVKLQGVTVQFVAKGATSKAFLLLWLLETLRVAKVPLTWSVIDGDFHLAEAIIKRVAAAKKKQVKSIQFVLPAIELIHCVAKKLKYAHILKHEALANDMQGLFSWTREVRLKTVGGILPHACELAGIRVPVRSWKDVDRYRAKATAWFARKSKPIVTFLYHWTKSEATDYVADSVLTSRTVVNHYKERGMLLELSDRPIKGAPFKLKQEVLVAAHAFLTEIEKNRAMVEGFNIKSKFVSISFDKRDGRSNRETLRLSRSSALMLTGERTQEPTYYLRQETPIKKVVQL